MGCRVSTQVHAQELQSAPPQKKPLEPPAEQNSAPVKATATATTTQTANAAHTDKTFLTYEEVLRRASPLDMFFFQGSAAFSAAIRHTEKLAFGVGDFSHVGIIVTTDVLPITNGVKGRLYVWEAIKGGNPAAPDVETREVRPGVQIRDVEAVLKMYVKPGLSRMAWARLKDNPCCAGDESLAKTRTRLTELHAMFNGAPYDANVVHLASAMSEKIHALRKAFAADAESSMSESDAAMFCSEWATRVYQAAGVFPEDFSAEQMAPQEFLVETNPSGRGVVVETPIDLTPH
eukprot:Opistho-2@36659